MCLRVSDEGHFRKAANVVNILGEGYLPFKYFQQWLLPSSHYGRHKNLGLKLIQEQTKNETHFSFTAYIIVRHPPIHPPTYSVELLQAAGSCGVFVSVYTSSMFLTVDLKNEFTETQNNWQSFSGFPLRFLNFV